MSLWVWTRQTGGILFRSFGTSPEWPQLLGGGSQVVELGQYTRDSERACRRCSRLRLGKTNAHTRKRHHKTRSHGAAHLAAYTAAAAVGTAFAWHQRVDIMSCRSKASFRTR